ncbi:MAG: ribosome small subunit-dependent GTPase A [Erysipelotrichaceae bacterium]|nr:ribosome small subunit-dependent GTPase A [Erysipelotrichaceae bacterium]MDY5252238.1 ribosome small subunit-dependent GTPase A [Erysipelotrichaceae bacterium]
MKGKIIKIISNQYTVIDENMQSYQCIAMGKVRLQMAPYVGDIVEVCQYDDKYAIEKIYERKNYLIRPAVANIDQLIIVMSAKDPDFSETLVDRISFLATYAKIKCVLCITKVDLIDDVSDIVAKYEKIMEVVTCDKYHVAEALQQIIGHKISVLTGQSGVGKSTLLNTINPEFKLVTQEISKALNRGKHTTRHCELHQVLNGWVCDTPGFSSLDFSHMEADELAQSVIEFIPHLGDCKFNDCLHVNEPGCKIKSLVANGEIAQSRYDNYLSVLKMIQERKVKYK